MAFNSPYEKPEVKSTLLELLDRNRDLFHVEFRGFRSNHLPMGLVALYEMGATEERLRSWFDTYSKRLEPKIVSSNSITRNNWKSFIGKKIFYGDYREFFMNELQNKHSKFVNKTLQTENVNHKHEATEDKREHSEHLQHSYEGSEESCLGFRGLVSHYFPQLMEGLAGSAFHPLILLGYAMRLDNADLAVDALAYLAYAYQSLGSLPARDLSNGIGFIDILERVLITHQRNPEYDASGFIFPDKLNHLLAKEPKVLDDADILRVDKTSVHQALDELLEVATELYSTTKNFFVLHLITGGHALRQILACLTESDQVLAIRYFARAFVAAYIVEGQPALVSQNVDNWQEELRRVSWDDVIQKAGFECEDVHEIKLAYSLWRENCHKYSPLNLLVAGHQVHLIAKKEEKFLERKAKKPIEVSLHEPTWASVVSSGIPPSSTTLPAAPEIHDREPRHRHKKRPADESGQTPAESGQGLTAPSSGQRGLSYSDAVKENLPEFKDEIKQKLKMSTETTTVEPQDTRTRVINASPEQLPFGVLREELEFVVQEPGQPTTQKDTRSRTPAAEVAKRRTFGDATGSIPSNRALLGQTLADKFGYYWNNYWELFVFGGALAASAGLIYLYQRRR